MQLLLKRSQKSSMGFSLIPLRIGSGTTFSIRASLELDDQERHLIKKYNLRNAMIVQKSITEEIKRSAPSAFILAFVAFVILTFIQGLFTALPISLVIFMIMTGVYFYAMREQITVDQLLDGGRYFHCHSVVELVHREDDLERVCQYLKQVLETAKTWDDREATAIEPLDKKTAKQLIRSAF